MRVVKNHILWKGKQPLRAAPVGPEEGVLCMEIMDEAWRQVGDARLRWPGETGCADAAACAKSDLGKGA